MNKLRRLMRLERARPSRNGLAARGVREFVTLDDTVFLETTDAVFEPDAAILCPAGEWAWFVRDRLINREALEQFERAGWAVEVVRLSPAKFAEDDHE